MEIEIAIDSDVIYSQFLIRLEIIINAKYQKTFLMS